MAEFDVEFVRDYVDPEMIAGEWPLSELDTDDLNVAVRGIYLNRRRWVLDALRKELQDQRSWQAEILDELDRQDADVFYFDDLLPERRDGEGWFSGLADALDEQGKFLDFGDFQRAARDQVRMNDEPLANLYHTLVLFFLQDNSEEYRKAERRLRNNPRNSSHFGFGSHTTRYFIRGETLIPYADEKVEPEFKIPGVGRKGRRLMRAVLFDDEDIDQLLAAERARFG